MTDNANKNTPESQSKPIEMCTAMAANETNPLVIDARLVIEVNIDTSNPSIENDRIVLLQEKCGYEKGFRVGELERFDEDWVRIRYFDAPASGVYSLRYVPNDEGVSHYTLFENVEFEALVNLTPDVDALENMAGKA